MKRFLITFIFSIMLGAFLASCSQQSKNPPQTISANDLTGTWVAHYGSGITGTIYLKDNGTFKQIYQDIGHDYHHDYHFETTWNSWELVLLPNVVRIRLQGARYYLEGEEVAENNGIGDPACHSDIPADCAGWLQPWEFYDPYTEDLVQMVNILLLDVRVDESGNLILHHLWTSSDRGFAIIGGDEEIFYRTTSNSSAQK
jgi:hypothetical protein